MNVIQGFLMGLGVIAILAIPIAFWGSIVYVLYHFIEKFW